MSTLLAFLLLATAQLGARNVAMATAPTGQLGSNLLILAILPQRLNLGNAFHVRFLRFYSFTRNERWLCGLLDWGNSRIHC